MSTPSKRSHPRVQDLVVHVRVGWIMETIKKNPACTERLETLRESARERRIALYKSDQ